MPDLSKEPLRDRSEHLILAPYEIEGGFLDRIKRSEDQAAPGGAVYKMLECQQYSQPLTGKHGAVV